MFKNYIKTAINNLLNNKLYSAINIIGLSIGITCCLLISIFIYHELNYDTFFSNADSIYRISPDFVNATDVSERHPAANVAPLGPLIANNIDGVQSVGRIGGMPALISKDDLVFYEDNFRWADNSIFDIFEFNWLRGNPDSALLEPDTVVISKSIALKYFGERDPIGETLMLQNSWPIRVTGVIEDIPNNSHLSADLIVPIETAWTVLGFNFENNWSYANFHTYVHLDADTNIEAVINQLEGVIEGTLDQNVAANFGINKDSFGFTTHRISEIHLWSGRAREFKEPGSVIFVLTFSAIALCVLLIACINFMNLSTAHSLKRAKEVGMRKTIGASRTELIAQFLGESFLLTIFAMVVALALVEMILPVFSTFINRDLGSNYLAEPEFLIFIIGTTLITGLLAGSYPAFYLSSFKPVMAFRQDSASTTKGHSIRNLLVVFQFSLAIILLISTLVIYLQMQHVRNIELGFNKDQVVVLRGTFNQGLGEQWPVLKQELLQHSDITHVTESDMSPGSAGVRKVRIEGGTDEGFDILAKTIGFDFFELYEIDLLAGRVFDDAFASDVFYPPPNVEDGRQPTGSYVLNETAIKTLGWSAEETIGKIFEVDFSSDFSVAVTGPVIGVVADTHVQPLHESILPLVYFVPGPMWGNFPSQDIASVRISSNNIEQTLSFIREKWREIIPEIPMFSYFLETEFDVLYQEEEQQGELFSLFSLLTITIACLGLFGLASYTAERRKKEIGVRKVLGGSVWSIVLLLTNDFSKLVLVSNIIAWPVAYLVMNRWLENFAYRIDLTPLIFIGSGLVALCVAWVTVGGIATKAARAKPVLGLRYE